MKVTVTISPNKGLFKGVSMQLPGMYPINGVMRIATESFDIVEERDLSPEKLKTYRPLQMILDNKNRQTLTYTFEKDVNKRNEGSNDSKIEKFVETFLNFHPQLLIDGNRHKNSEKAQADFDMTIDVNAMVKKQKNLQDGHVAQSILLNMPFDQLRNVADYYGVSVKADSGDNKSQQELLVELADPITGKCMQEDVIENFLKVWSEPSKETEHEVICKKAIRLGVIDQRDVNGQTYYYLNEQALGVNFEDVTAYCRKDDKIFNDFVKRKVAELDTYENNASDTERVSNQLNGARDDDYNGVAIIFKELQEKGFIPKKFEGKKLNPWEYRKRIPVLKKFIEEGLEAEKKSLQSV